MEYVSLGRTGLQVSRLCLGCMSFGDPKRPPQPRGHVGLAWLLSKPVIAAPVIGATKLQHLKEAFEALNFHLSHEEIQALEEPYVPHPVDGVVPPLPAEGPALSPPR